MIIGVGIYFFIATLNGIGETNILGTKNEISSNQIPSIPAMIMFDSINFENEPPEIPAPTVKLYSGWNLIDIDVFGHIKEKSWTDLKEVTDGIYVLDVSTGQYITVTEEILMKIHGYGAWIYVTENIVLTTEEYTTTVLWIVSADLWYVVNSATSKKITEICDIKKIHYFDGETQMWETEGNGPALVKLNDYCELEKMNIPPPDLDWVNPKFSEDVTLDININHFTPICFKNPSDDQKKLVTLFNVVEKNQVVSTKGDKSYWLEFEWSYDGKPPLPNNPVTTTMVMSPESIMALLDIPKNANPPEYSCDLKFVQPGKWKIIQSVSCPDLRTC